VALIAVGHKILRVVVGVGAVWSAVQSEVFGGTNGGLDRIAKRQYPASLDVERSGFARSAQAREVRLGIKKKGWK
jgi:hypothetical protein